MTTLLERAVAELKKRPDREQDDIARDILARLGETSGCAQSSAFGRGKSVLRLVDPEDDLIEILTDDDIRAWDADGRAAG